MEGYKHGIQISARNGHPYFQYAVIHLRDGNFGLVEIQFGEDCLPPGRRCVRGSAWLIKRLVTRLLFCLNILRERV